MARVGIGYGRYARAWGCDSQGLKDAGYKVAASYAGNDAAAEKFKADTGIPVYKWDVSSFEACAAASRRSRPTSARSTSRQQCRHHQGHSLPQDDARSVERRHQHIQSRLAVQHEHVR